MSGSEGGSEKRTGGNAGTAPRPDPYPVVERYAWPSWRWTSGSGIPSCSSSRVRHSGAANAIVRAAPHRHDRRDSDVAEALAHRRSSGRSKR